MVQPSASLPRYFWPGLLAVVLLGSLVLKLNQLGHAHITFWDESYHAIVARNLVKHPLRPTLIDTPYLEYDPVNWYENHVWLHKPVLPLWQIALAYALLGVNAFALRLPSVLLSTGAAGITYMIGRECLSSAAGLIAATLQALCPAIVLLMHGYVYSDHIDISLLFWSEVGIYFVIRALRTGSWRDTLLAGVGCGLAYLSKSYLGVVVLAVAGAAWLLSWWQPTGWPAPLRGRQLVGCGLAFLLTIAPWSLYCLIMFPRESQIQYTLHFSHLTSSVDAWGAPWDRQLFDYCIFLYGALYIPAVVAGGYLTLRAWRERQTAVLLIAAWAFGVLLLRTVAHTKTPSGALVGMPPFFLLLGELIVRAWRRDTRALAVWAALPVVLWLIDPPYGQLARGYPEPPVFAGVLRQRPWVLWQLLSAVGISLALAPVLRRLRRGQLAICVLATLLFLPFAWRYAGRTRSLCRGPVEEPNFQEVAAYAQRHLPLNAVLLVDDRAWRPDAVEHAAGEHQLLMFYADRTAYLLRGRDLETTVRRIASAGGVPYLVSGQRLPLPAVYVSRKDRRTVYALTGESSSVQE